MHSLRKTTIGVAAALLLVITSGAQAQSKDDLALMQQFLSIMTDYFQIIESSHDIASDPEKAAIMQMQKIQEVYEQRGEKVRCVDVLQKVLSDSKNGTIRNAAYMLLGDTLKEAGRTDEALALLRRGLEENIKAAQ